MQISKIEWGALASIIAGAVWLGTLQGKINILTTDDIVKNKKDAIKEINIVKKNIIDGLDKKYISRENSSKIHTDINIVIEKQNEKIKNLEKIILKYKKSSNVTYKEEKYPSGKKHFIYRSVSNVLNGETIEFKSNGSVFKKYTYKNGELHGITKQYGDNDYVDWFYQNGKLISAVEYYNSGEIKINYKLVNESFEGLSLEFFKDGKIKSQWRYKNGKLDGKSKIFNRDGTVVGEDIYKKGVFIK